MGHAHSGKKLLSLHVHPFYHHLLVLSFLGSLALFLLPSRHDRSPAYIDVLYMSVSVVTVTGLNSVEIESMSTSQLMVITFLMLAGGEVFVSRLALTLRCRKPCILGYFSTVDPESAMTNEQEQHALVTKYRCLAALRHVILFHIVVSHIVGMSAIALFLWYTPSARGVLRTKGLPLAPAALCLTVAAFSNGGLAPTNESMIVFVKSPGLSLIFIVLLFVGNTLFSSTLRALISVLYRITKREECGDMLGNPERLRCEHLHAKKTTVVVAASVMGLWAAEFVAFLALEWNKGHHEGMSSFERIASAAFLATNTRHGGATTVDVSQLSADVLVMFMVAMYLPSYTHIWSFEEGDEIDYGDKGSEKGFRKWLRIANLTQISYVAIFIFVVCIIERKNMSTDPLNFSFLFVAFEVVSAYGNVGFSAGYACARQLNRDSSCRDAWISLSGRWGGAGKLAVMFIMLFGRLKRFHCGGGKAWRGGSHAVAASTCKAGDPFDEILHDTPAPTLHLRRRPTTASTTHPQLS